MTATATHTVCACCGASTDVGEPLVAACDVLVIRALELIGKRVVRLDRSRFARMGSRPFHEAHLLWQPDRRAIDQGLADAWQQVESVTAAYGCCGITGEQLTLTLDRYVRDLCATMTGHDPTEMRYRLAMYLDA